MLASHFSTFVLSFFWVCLTVSGQNEESKVSNEVSCGAKVSGNNVIFISGLSSATLPQAKHLCELSINLGSKTTGVQVIMDECVLAPPTLSTGHCTRDAMWIHGATNFHGPICGTNSGQNLFLSVLPSTEMKIIIASTETFVKRWRMRIIQIPKGSPALPPSGCLQYLTSTEGVFSSFNADLIARVGYGNIHSLKYPVCFKPLSKYCHVEITPHFFQMDGIPLLPNLIQNQIQIPKSIYDRLLRLSNQLRGNKTRVKRGGYSNGHHGGYGNQQGQGKQDDYGYSDAQEGKYGQGYSYVYDRNKYYDHNNDKYYHYHYHHPSSESSEYPPYSPENPTWPTYIPPVTETTTETETETTEMTTGTEMTTETETESTTTELTTETEPESTTTELTTETETESTTTELTTETETESTTTELTTDTEAEPTKPSKTWFPNKPGLPNFPGKPSWPMNPAIPLKPNPSFPKQCSKQDSITIISKKKEEPVVLCGNHVPLNVPIRAESPVSCVVDNNGISHGLGFHFSYKYIAC